MRITGGELRGRVLKVPRSPGVRPTQDMVRQGLFSMLGERLADAAFLDLYAGTGAVGIEAWSRGAARVCWVESGAQALRTLAENVQTLCPSAGRIVRGETLRVLRYGFVEAPFDVIFADPPYGEKQRGRRAEGMKPEGRKPEGGGRDGAEWAQVLATIVNGGLLKPGGWLIMEQREGEAAVVPAGWQLLRDRRYGGTRLRILEQGDGINKEVVTET